MCWFLLYSKVIQLYRYIHTPFLRFCSHISHYRVLNRILCAIQQVLISCLILSSEYMSNPISQFSSSSPLGKFCTSVTLFCKQVHLYHFFFFFRFRIKLISDDICLSLFDFTQCLSMSPRITLFHSLSWQSSIPLYICITSLSIHLSMDIQVASMCWLLYAVLNIVSF